MTNPNAHAYRTRARHPPPRVNHSPRPQNNRSNSPAAPALAKIRPSPTTTPSNAANDHAPTKFHPAGSPPPPADAEANYPTFPPPDVSLHKDDALSKVFLAIGRSFLSVDNRAMTIKDLSEMTLKFGLICQNVSAAGQAITTFIRNHMQRCEREQDHPLLSRHILSGTNSDDDLLPALHSRTGGAHCALPPGDARVTNFRRGTMVWYLSRAAGGPCPFARAGIRLAEYTEDGRVDCPGTVSGPRERKRERDRRRRITLAQQQQLCGQKRKRLARGCKAEAPSGDEEDVGAGDSEVDARPPKIKLTLRLPPSLSSSCSPAPMPILGPPALDSPMSQEDEEEEEEESDNSSSSESSSESNDSMSVDSDSDSGCIAGSSSDAFVSPPPSAFFRMPSPSSFANSFHHDLYARRSPSLAPLPPDSEDECEDGYDGYDRARLDFSDEDDMDWSSDEDGEGEPIQDLSSTSAAVVVKQEPVDEDAIGGLLQEWDSRDRGAESRRVLEVVEAAASISPPSPTAAVVVKREEPDAWEVPGTPVGEHADAWPADPSVEWSPEGEWDASPDTEWTVEAPATTEAAGSSPSSSPPPLPSSSIQRPRRASELLWQDAEMLGLETIGRGELDEGEWIARPTPSVQIEVAELSASEPLEIDDTPTAAPSPEAESEGPCTPPSSLPTPGVVIPQIRSGSPFGLGNRHFVEPPAVEVREKAEERGDFLDGGVGEDEEEEEEEAGAGLRLWDLKVLRESMDGRSSSPAPVETEDPLSPTEEEMFHVLCDVGDFEPRGMTKTESVAAGESQGGEGEVDAGNMVEEEMERPLALRRSKRVEAQKKASAVVVQAGGRKRRPVR